MPAPSTAVPPPPAAGPRPPMPAAPPIPAAAPKTRGTALVGLCSALLPQEHGGPDPVALAARVASFLRTQPPSLRAAVTAGALSYEAVALCTTGRTLARLHPVGRARALRRSSPGALSVGLDAMKALVLLVAGAEQATAEVVASANASPPARPDAMLSVTPAMGWPSTSRCDVVVVGSGAGGATAARTLARAGLDVVVVEEGRRHTVGEFRTGAPLQRFTSLYRDGGMTAAFGLPPVVLPIGRGVGGTTLVNSGTCYRTPAAVLTRWRDDAGLALADPETFSRHLDEVWSMLGVGPVPLGIMGRNGHLLLEGAERLGWRAAPIDRNAPGCGGCCQCSIGCPRNAKFGVHLNALPDACAAGARIVSEARVVRVLTRGGRAEGVLAARRDGSRLTIRAPLVVVAAGATETPPLLRRSDLGDHPGVGRNLAVHPAVGLSGWFDERVTAWHGVLQSAAVDEFHDSDGVLVEATATPPGMGSMVLPGLGPELVHAVETADHLATFGVMVADQGAGRVHGANRPTITYGLTRRDGRRIVRAIEVTARLLLAAGARRVLTGVPGHLWVDSERTLEEAVAHADPRRLHLAAFHPVGTVAAGADAGRFPVDPTGRLRGAEGVMVADASLMPTCPEVNPRVTVMALAAAVAEGIVAAR